MKRFHVMDGLSLGAIALSSVLSVLLYEQMPRRIATHFDAHGVADGFMPRMAGAFVLPAVALVSWAVLRLAPPTFPRSWRERLEASPTHTVAFLVTALLVCLHVVIVHVALRGASSVGAGIGVALGAFWLAIGLVMPRVRRNPIVGIRTPWTITSDENWARTHRLGGYTFAAGGAVCAMASLAGAIGWPVGVLLASGLLPAVYSFVLSRRTSS